MTKTYQYRSGGLNGTVKATFKDGILIAWELEPELTAEHYQTKRMQVTISEAGFLQSAKENGVKLIEVDRIVTFEMAWEKFDDKRCGIKKGRASWNVLSKQDQIEAYDFIAHYKAEVKLSGVAHLHFTTYLNQQRWQRK